MILLTTSLVKVIEKCNTEGPCFFEELLKNINLDQALVNEIKNAGIKFDADNLLRIAKNTEGRIVFLEKGSPKGGLVHILEHEADFINKGVTKEQIPDLVMKEVTEGKIIGYQGKGTGRPIYQVEFNGKTQNVGVTIGSNGFIVGANPKSIK